MNGALEHGGEISMLAILHLEQIILVKTLQSMEQKY
jgi:hypothetical protein